MRGSAASIRRAWRGSWRPSSHRATAPSALASVRVPTLVIHGDADPLVRHEGGVATAKAIPGARLLTIDGMGHALPISMWPQLIDAIAAHAR